MLSRRHHLPFEHEIFLDQFAVCTCPAARSVLTNRPHSDQEQTNHNDDYLCLAHLTCVVAKTLDVVDLACVVGHLNQRSIARVSLVFEWLASRQHIQPCCAALSAVGDVVMTTANANKSSTITKSTTAKSRLQWPELQNHNKNKTLAFLFLSNNNDTLNEDIWEPWFRAAGEQFRPLYSIFVHTTPAPLGQTVPLGPFFCPHAIPSVPNKWGALHHTMMRLLEHAFYADPNASYFVFVSATSIPLISLQDMYRQVVVEGDQSQQSRLCWADQAEPVWMKKYIKLGLDASDLRKASLWSGLIRPHVELVLQHQNTTLRAWDRELPHITWHGAPDEIFIPTLLNLARQGKLQQQHRNNNNDISRSPPIVSSRDFSNCTSAVGLPKLRTCCTHAVYWGNSYARVKWRKHAVRVPIKRLATAGFRVGGSPKHFGNTSLLESGLRGLQQEGFHFLRKVQAATLTVTPDVVARSGGIRSKHKIKLVDALLHLTSSDKPLAATATQWNNKNPEGGQSREHKGGNYPPPPPPPPHQCPSPGLPGEAIDDKNNKKKVVASANNVERVATSWNL